MISILDLADGHIGYIRNLLGTGVGCLGSGSHREDDVLDDLSDEPMLRLDCDLCAVK